LLWIWAFCADMGKPAATSAIAAHRLLRLRMRGEKYKRIGSFHCDTNRRNSVVPEMKKPWVRKRNGVALKDSQQ
jgi:hypothetical protein